MKFWQIIFWKFPYSGLDHITFLPHSLNHTIALTPVESSGINSHTAITLAPL